MSYHTIHSLWHSTLAEPSNWKISLPSLSLFFRNQTLQQSCQLRGHMSSVRMCLFRRLYIRITQCRLQATHIYTFWLNANVIATEGKKRCCANFPLPQVLKKLNCGENFKDRRFQCRPRLLPFPFVHLSVFSPSNYFLK